MGEGQQQDNTGQGSGRMLRILAEGRRFVRETMDLHWEAHIESTTEIIRKDMIFRGHVVWVLVCSIFIASIGLNVNSTAVIVGAMLISPLMGPILATGLAVGTNDMDLLRRGLKNFLVMVVVALIASTVYSCSPPSAITRANCWLAPGHPCWMLGWPSLAG